MLFELFDMLEMIFWFGLEGNEAVFAISAWISFVRIEGFCGCFTKYV